MKAQIYYNTYKRSQKVQTGNPNATTSALCSGKTDRTIDGPEYIFIGKHPLNVLTNQSILCSMNLNLLEKKNMTSV